MKLICPVLLCVLTVVMACDVPLQEGQEPPPLATQHAPQPETAPAADPDAHHLFYLHGRIIESSGRRPTHAKFGVYEYDRILESFSDAGYHVISEVRVGTTDVSTYAAKIVDQINDLIASGTAPDRITVVGFSKGGIIAIRVATLLGRDDVNFVFLASCGPWVDMSPELVPRGQLLSIYEESDDMAGSCSSLFARTVLPTRYREITLALGHGHGAFYTPNPSWVRPIALYTMEQN